MDEMLICGDLVLVRYNDFRFTHKVVSALRGEIQAINRIAVRVRVVAGVVRPTDYVVPWTSIIDVEVLQEATE